MPLTVRSTVHGPIVSDVLDTLDEAGAQAPTPEPAPFSPEGYAVSLSWTALTPGRTADAVFALNQATNWDEFRSAAELFEVPSQNLVYADTDGNIGYQAPGKIPVRRPGSGLGQADGTWPRPGWSSDWDWQGYIPFQDLPSVRNPDEGFIVAANQQVIGAEYRYRLTSDWDYGYRSQRIRDVLTEKIADGEKLDAADMNELQTDTTNGFADALVPSLLAAPPVDGDTAATRQFTAEAVQLLRDWDGSQPAAQTGDDPAGPPRPPRTSTRCGATCCGSPSRTSCPSRSTRTAAAAGSRWSPRCSPTRTARGGTTQPPRPSPSRATR